ncbi:MAG: Pleiotropic regulatory protein [uncultured bacterium]|nr:MAG: Pleiotropic regulatory protein [uncultured bacterium]
MDIPFNNLYLQYLNIKDEIDTGIQSVINNCAFIRGKYVQEFEQKYAISYGVKHCISCGNGTDAIYICLKSLGIKSGDDVITTSSSWISTSETITQTGATPVFIDIEPDFYSIDASKIEKKISERTKAIIPVHLYGHPAEMLKIKQLCQKYNLYLIEDCAQAHFAEYNDSRVGTFGDFGTFSFYPGKNIGAFGDAGAIITNNDDLACQARMYANHGSLKKHDHKIEGINSRMDGLQAAILSIKLKYIGAWTNKRIENARYYNDCLKGIEYITIPKIREGSTHVFHLYVIRCPEREALIEYLKRNNIETGIHYPKALPFLEAYKYLGHIPEDFPVINKFQNEILSLPMFPELKINEIEFISEKIREFYS